MNGLKGRNWGGVYIFRTRRPGLFGRVPVLGRHFAYVGQGRVRSRYRDHMQGSVKYNSLPKPWADLKPSWYFIPLPYWKWLLHTVETALILCLWPVYNHQKNLWNPRRISLRAAKRQRGSRDVMGWSFNFRFGHLILWIAGVTLALINGWVPWR